MDLKIMIKSCGDTLSQEVVELLHKKQANYATWPRDEKGIPWSCDSHSGLTQVLKNVDVLFLIQHLGPEMPGQMERFAAAAKAAGVSFVVRLSMWGASRGSPYFFRRLHGEADHALMQSGVKYCLIRSNIFMQKFIKPLGEELSKGALYLPQGEGKTSFIDIRDVAEVVTLILQDPFKHHHRIYELSGERAISNAEAVSLISHQAGRRLAYVPVTEENAQRVLEKGPMLDWERELWLSWSRAVRDMKLAGVNSVVEDLLKRKPRRFEDFCKEVRWSRIFGPEPEPLL